MLENKELSLKELDKVTGGAYSLQDPEIARGRQIYFDSIDKSFKG